MKIKCENGFKKISVFDQDPSKDNYSVKCIFTLYTHHDHVLEPEPLKRSTISEDY